jgi:hypothetical protein
MQAKRVKALVGLYSLLVVAAVSPVFLLPLYQNMFQLRLGDGQGQSIKVLFTKHFSSVHGRHFYTLYQPERNEDVSEPSADILAWSLVGKERIDGDGITVTGQNCGVALRFNTKGNLIGIGSVTEDGLGSVQTFPPVPLAVRKAYTLSEDSHANGAYCIFRTNPNPIAVNFGVWVNPASLQPDY